MTVKLHFRELWCSELKRMNYALFQLTSKEF